MAHFGSEMRRHNRRGKKKTVAKQIGVSPKTISAKISKVAHENPNLDHDAVVGRAIGTLRHRKKKRRKLL